MDVLVISALFGLAVPYVISFLKNVKWPKAAKVVCALIVSVAAAFLSLAVDGSLGSLTWAEIVANSAVVFATAQIYYRTYFEGTVLNAKLENVKVLGK